MESIASGVFCGEEEISADNNDKFTLRDTTKKEHFQMVPVG
jgi:hypothetical protein